jgi:hypothetical protein
LCDAQDLGESQICKAVIGSSPLPLLAANVIQYIDINKFFAVHEAWHEA